MLVEQALLVSQELIRVAILVRGTGGRGGGLRALTDLASGQWPELWQEGIDEAFRQCFAHNNNEGTYSLAAGPLASTRQPGC